MFTKKTLSAENTFCDPLGVGAGGHFTVSISGDSVGVLTLQVSRDNRATWADVAAYSGPVEDYGFEAEGADFRMGFKPGAYTSGTAIVRIGVAA